MSGFGHCKLLSSHKTEICANMACQCRAATPACFSTSSSCHPFGPASFPPPVPFPFPFQFHFSSISIPFAFPFQLHFRFHLHTICISISISTPFFNFTSTPFAFPFPFQLHFQFHFHTICISIFHFSFKMFSKSRCPFSNL